MIMTQTQSASVTWKQSLATLIVFSMFLNIASCTDYTVGIKTHGGWLYNSGTSDPVFLTIVGNTGQTKPIRFRSKKGSFKQNSLTTMTVSASKDIGAVCGVVLKKSGNDDWHVKYVTISDQHSAKKINFSYNRWIKDDKLYTKKQKAIDGGWGEWGKWSVCPKCGGTQTRQRHCNKPSSSCGGKACVGPNSMNVSCRTDDCHLPVTTRKPTRAMSTLSIQTTADVSKSIPKDGGNQKIPIIVSVITLIIAVIIIIVLVVICRKRKKKTRAYQGRSSPDRLHVSNIYAETNLSEPRSEEVANLCTVVPKPIIDNSKQLKDQSVKPRAMKPSMWISKPDVKEENLETMTPSQRLAECEYYNDINTNGVNGFENECESNYYENMSETDNLGNACNSHPVEDVYMNPDEGFTDTTSEVPVDKNIYSLGEVTRMSADENVYMLPDNDVGDLPLGNVDDYGYAVVSTIHTNSSPLRTIVPHYLDMSKSKPS